MCLYVFVIRRANKATDKSKIYAITYGGSLNIRNSMADPDD